MDYFIQCMLPHNIIHHFKLYIADLLKRKNPLRWKSLAVVEIIVIHLKTFTVARCSFVWPNPTAYGALLLIHLGGFAVTDQSMKPSHPERFTIYVQYSICKFVCVLIGPMT